MPSRTARQDLLRAGTQQHDAVQRGQGRREIRAPVPGEHDGALEMELPRQVLEGELVLAPARPAPPEPPGSRSRRRAAAREARRGLVRAPCAPRNLATGRRRVPAPPARLTVHGRGEALDVDRARHQGHPRLGAPTGRSRAAMPSLTAIRASVRPKEPALGPGPVDGPAMVHGTNQAGGRAESSQRRQPVVVGLMRVDHVDLELLQHAPHRRDLGQRAATDARSARARSPPPAESRTRGRALRARLPACSQTRPVAAHPEGPREVERADPRFRSTRDSPPGAGSGAVSPAPRERAENGRLHLGDVDRLETAGDRSDTTGGSRGCRPAGARAPAGRAERARSAAGRWGRRVSPRATPTAAATWAGPLSAPTRASSSPMSAGRGRRMVPADEA